MEHIRSLFIYQKDQFVMEGGNLNSLYSNKLNLLQKTFINSFEDYMSSLYRNFPMLNNIDIEFNFDSLSDEVEITICNPKNEDYNIFISISNEIIVFFNHFHMHFENYSNDKEIPALVEEALIMIGLLITAKEIIITILVKGKSEYKRKLDVTRQDGSKQTIENYYVGFNFLLFFIPTKEISISVTFI